MQRQSMHDILWSTESSSLQPVIPPYTDSTSNNPTTPFYPSSSQSTTTPALTKTPFYPSPPNGFIGSPTSQKCEMPDNQGQKKFVVTKEMGFCSRITNAFGTNLFMRLHQQNGQYGANTCLSPLSVSLAFGMLAGGVNDDGELARVLYHDRISSDPWKVAQLLRSMMNLFLSCDGVDLTIANAAFTKEVNEHYQKNVQETFGAEIYPLTNVNTINNWCANKTHGLISQVLDHLDPYTVMVLVNAIYFKGIWTKQFEPTNTKQDWFTTQQGNQIPCNLMFLEKKLGHYIDDTAEICHLNYGSQGSPRFSGKESSFAACLILPRSKREPLSHFIIHHLEKHWDTWSDTQFVQQSDGYLYLPKLDMDSGAMNIIPHLRDMGYKKSLIMEY